MENFYKDNDRLKHQLSHPLLRDIVALRENNYAESAEYACAPKDFEDAVECYDKAMEVFGEICAETIAVNAPKVDKQGPSCENGRVTYADGTQENHRVLTEASFYGLSLPRKYDGLNFPTVLSIMASEMVARADAGFQNIWSLQDCAETINEFGDEELKAAMLPRISKGATCSMDLTEPDAGSDLQSAMLKATWDEENNTWRLNGVKRFITNGDADIKLVLARSEEGTTDARGLSLYVYDKQWGGVTVRRIEHKLGIKGSPTCELVFDNAPAKLIGSRRMGLIKYVMSLMNGARLGIGAQAVGISEAALQAAKRYASERKQFGKAIMELAPVYEMIGVMQAKLDAARALLYETSRFVDFSKAYSEISKSRSLEPEERQKYKAVQKSADMLTPILKMMSSEYSNQITYDAIQVFGGSGVVQDFPVERYYRDARVTSIYEGTSQLQVVAAVKYVSNGELLAKIKEYVAAVTEPEIAARFNKLIEQFEKACEICTTAGGELFTFHSRRLVEMGGHIVMSALLYQDKEFDARSAESFAHYLKMAEAWNMDRLTYIENFGEADLASLKEVAAK